MTEYFRIVDTETTGPKSTPPDVACELATVDLNWEPDTKTHQLVAPRSELVGIGIAMPPDAQGIHHIGDADLKDARDLAHVFKSVIAPYPFPEKIILAAHNAEYEFGTVRDVDGKLLKERVPEHVPIICTLKAAYRLWPDAPNHKNQTLRYYLKLTIPDKLKGGLPHRALPDAVVTALILVECLKLAPIEHLIQWTKEPRLLPTCPIGKKQGWAGKKWSEVDSGFLTWMINDADDMDADLKWNAQYELTRRERVRHTEGRAKYMEVVPKVIAMAQSVFDLRQWFKDEMATRVSLGISEGTEEYATIVQLCKNKTAILPQPVQPAPAKSPPLAPVSEPESAGPIAATDPPADDEPDLTHDPSEQVDDAA